MNETTVIREFAALSAFEAAEIAMDRAMTSERVRQAKALTEILGGNGDYTAEVAFEVWQAEMVEMGHAETALGHPGGMKDGSI